MWSLMAANGGVSGMSGSLERILSERETTSQFLQRKWQSWILLNTSWSSKWWYSFVHNITAIVGSGVLSLPSAMAPLSWEFGTFAILLFIVLSLVCYWQVIGMHEMDGRRFDRYHELGERVLGKKLGFWLIVPLQMMVEVGVDTVYVITGASSLKKVLELLCDVDTCHDLKLSYWMMIFVALQFLLSQLPHLASITSLSCVAAATAVGYSTLAWVAMILQDDKKALGLEDASPPISHEYSKGSTADIVFDAFAALGKIAFACASGQNIALEIQATIPSTAARPSKVPMWNGILVAYIVIALCYLPVALLGYWRYGNQTPKTCLRDDKLRDCHLLLFLNKPKWLIVLANLMIVLHMCGSYQVYAMPLFNNLETFAEKKLNIKANTFVIRTSIRYSYIAFTLLLAASFPFFGSLEAFFGGFAIFPTTYLIPCILWHLTARPRQLGLPWCANVACIVCGVVCMVIMTAGGLRNLIVDSSQYEFYQ